MVIKAGTKCPYYDKCIYVIAVKDTVPLSQKCGHKGVDHPVDFNCDVAQGYLLEETIK